MPLTPERAAAHAKLEEAIEGLLNAYGTFDQGEYPFAHVLLVAGTRFLDPVLDEEVFDADDGDETQSALRFTQFAKRGQNPVTTMGLLAYATQRHLAV